MEGLIPYIIAAIRKQKPGHMKSKSLSHSHSNSSERSYHLLLGSDSSEFLELVSSTANNLRNRKS
ncbi:hypothetical protein AAZV13_11G001400 [Glycine max]